MKLKLIGGAYARYLHSMGLGEVAEELTILQDEINQQLFPSEQNAPPKLWQPQAGAQEAIQQAIVHQDHIQHIAVHGSRGGGKTYAIVMSISERILKYGKHFNGIYLRETADALKEIKELFLNNVGAHLGCSGGLGTSNTIKFGNGAILKFSHFGKDGLSKIKGGNFSDIVVEEADDVKDLKTKMPVAMPALRSDKVPVKLVLAYNYTGVSYPYLKGIFHQQPHFKEFKINDFTHLSIKSFTQENQILLTNQPQYLHAFDSLPTAFREAWLNANEDVQLGGMAFDCFSADNNGVLYEDIRPLGCKFIVGIDWGFKDKAVAVFVAVMQGFFVVIDTVVREGVLPREFAQAVKSKINYYNTNNNHIGTVIDPSTGGNMPNNVRHQLYSYGLPTEPANNDRIGGFMYAYSLIKKGKLRVFAEQQGELAESRAPASYSTKEIWQTIPNLVMAEDNMADISKNPKQDDHCYDALRYALMSLKNVYGAE